MHHRFLFWYLKLSSLTRTEEGAEATETGCRVLLEIGSKRDG